MSIAAWKQKHKCTRTYLLEVGLLDGDAFGLDHALRIVGLDARGVRLRLLCFQMPHNEANKER